MIALLVTARAWLGGRLGGLLGGLLPIALAVLAGLALVAGLQRRAERAGRAAAALEQRERERANARAQEQAAADYRRDGAAERLRAGRF